MTPAGIITKKRDGEQLTPEELGYFINGIITGGISEAQTGAFLMACYFQGLTSQESAAMTFIMRDSGKSFNFRSIGKPIIDKHSTGGVGDKVSLLLAPLAASCGLAVPMISGRGLGHTGGTVDKMESISGFCMSFEDAELERLLKENGFFMIGQSADVAPADRILYHTRDVTGTVESIGLITSSIMSKKLVEDLDGLVLDLKVGAGAFMSNIDNARKLAEGMFGVAREINLPMRVVFSAMNQPLGDKIGNWTEVEETIDALDGKAPPDLRLITEKLAVAMLLTSKIVNDEAKAYQIVRQNWDNGTALKKFYLMISSQGGDIDKSRQQYANVERKPVLAKSDGFINFIHAKKIGLAAISLGAGRLKQNDRIDYSAGIVFRKKAGDRVALGEEIAYVQGCNRLTFDRAIDEIHAAITYSPEKPEPEQLIIDEWIV